MEAKDPRWEPGRGPKPSQEPLRCHSAAWSSPSRRQDASQGAKGRLVHVFASHFGTQTSPQGVPNRTKKRSKSETKNMFVLDHVSGLIFIDLGVQKTSLFGPEKGSKFMQRLQGTYVNSMEKPLKKQHFQVSTWTNSEQD